jgi:ABC-type uncharacterized transport system substrate-binding protein
MALGWWRRLTMMAAAATAILGAGAPPAAAHPHVWIDYELTVIFAKGQVTALRQQWTFDEDFTAAVLRDIAGAKPGAPLGKAEIAKIEKDAFSNLAHYDYFAHVFAGEGKVGVGKAAGFSAHLAGPKLVYDFDLPLATPVDAKAMPAGIGIWDDTYYVDVGPAEGKLPKLEGEGAAGCKAVIVEDHQHPIYFGSVFPKIVRVTC